MFATLIVAQHEKTKWTLTKQMWFVCGLRVWFVCVCVWFMCVCVGVCVCWCVCVCFGVCGFVCGGGVQLVCGWWWCVVSKEDVIEEVRV